MEWREPFASTIGSRVRIRKQELDSKVKWSEEKEDAPLPRVAGVELATAEAGYKYRERADLLICRFAPGTVAAGVTTRSLCASPEVEWCRTRLAAGGEARALIVSAGNSNAFTGRAGADAAKRIAASAANALNVPEAGIYLSATGVIGEPLPAEKGERAIAGAAGRLGEAKDWVAAAAAIGTTDTFTKTASATAIVGGETVTLVGIAKGSGMIAPDMATMLAYVFTDANVSAKALQAMVAAANRLSFSCITVDGDTSTSDTLLAFATASADAPRIETQDSPGADALQAAITDICTDLAKQIVRDGEGASKFITIDVTGAASAESAHRIALSIANSPLVKTAIAGEDANWGRIVMAVGKAGEPADRDRLSIRFGNTVVAEAGARVPDYEEAPVSAHLKGAEIDIGVDIGIGEGRARVWTCDLTHGYISINADYRS